MSAPFDPNNDPTSGTSPANSGGQYPQYGTPPTPNQPIPPATPYPGPPPAGYPAAPQGYPYGAYPPQYGPYGYPPQQPPRKNNTTLWVILGVVAVVVIGACVGCAILVGGLFGFASRVVTTVQPVIVAQTFCDNEQSADYSAAYDQLSPSLQASISRADFLSQSTARDTSEGAVTTCDVNVSSLGGITSASTSATVDVTMSRTLAGSFAGTVSLVKNGSTWTIDTIDPALPILTDGTPTGTPTQQATATPS